MKLKSIDLPFVLLTSAMNGGAQENGPAEVRIASIRGQVRAWHRKAGLTPACDEVWGRAADGATTASRVSLSLLPQLKAETHKDEPILPHHPVGGIRSAVTHNQTFTLRLTRPALLPCRRPCLAGGRPGLRPMGASRPFCSQTVPHHPRPC